MSEFKQPALPYALNALEPFLSEEQMDYHYSKHHAAYFKKLNGFVSGTPDADKSLETLITTTSHAGIFNNAAQAWNHIFFWNCMSPVNGGGSPKDALLSAMDRDFGGFEKCMEAFSQQATNLFGSGWAWIAADDNGKLEVLALSNADNPLAHGKHPILGLDVWEHSYYIDYRNERPRFIKAFCDVINWEFCLKQYQAVTT